MRQTTLAALAALILALPLHGQDGASGPVIQVMGFGDIGYVATERDVPEGFVLGQAVGHVNAILSDRLFFFGEISASARAAGFAIEAERLILRYDFADQFKLSAGRFHTPIGFWNTAYHHGSWLQTTVGRPEVVRYGSRLVPVHFVGLLAEGNLPGSPLGPSYTAGVGNGRHANIARAGDAGDVNGRRAALLSLALRPVGLAGLQIGSTLYLDRAAVEQDGGGAEVDERILSAHLVREREDPELIAEYAHMLHDPVGGIGEAAASEAYYVQVGYRLPGGARALKPYARAERIRIARGDLLLSPTSSSYDALIGGIRYDFAPYAALKAEVRSEEFAAAERYQSLHLQASFAIPGPSAGSGMIHAAEHGL